MKPLHKLIAAALLFIAVSSTAIAQHSTDEPTQLTAIQRQIEHIQQTIQLKRLEMDKASRYHFDYQRLNADLEKIHTGIKDYLSPRRAQPRDPVKMHGHYQQEQR
ncbi:MAG: RAQPRD family integrative conjugative element protein [Saezia sp.]